LRPYSIALCVFVGALYVYAQSPSSDKSLAADPVYKSNCATCHGKTADGRHFGGPSLYAAVGIPDDELRNMISNGKGRMPRFATKLTSEQIDSLVQEIKSLKK
jgi:mono/diheme cytochrome c family protein